MRSHRRLLTIVAFLGAVTAAALDNPPLALQQTPPISDSRDATLPNFDLPVEPVAIRSVPGAPAQSLDSTAAANDYASFSAAYAAARTRGESSGAYADLQALWEYQQENPVGAWYGQEIYDRLARTYPGYASYIADFAIVDSRGQTFYPSTETRQFLLQQARNGNTTRSALASSTNERVPSTRVASAAKRAAVTPLPSRPARASRKRYTKASVDQQPSRRTPVQTAALPKVEPAAVPATTPAITPAAQPHAASATPAATNLAPTSRGLMTAAMVAPIHTADANAAGDQPTTRGLILLVLGLVGVGMLTVLMRTPAPAPAEASAAPEAAASTNVEAISERSKEPRDARRATGSRG